MRSLAKVGTFHSFFVISQLVLFGFEGFDEVCSSPSPGPLERSCAGAKNILKRFPVLLPSFALNAGQRRCALP